MPRSSNVRPFGFVSARGWLLARGGGMAMVVAMASTSALAAPPQLERAQKLAHRFEYEQALDLLDEILASESLPRDDRISALLLRGRILVGFGCNARTIANYHELLAVQPGATLDPMESPKVRACFSEARASAPPPPAPTIVPEPAAQPPTEVSASAVESPRAQEETAAGPQPAVSRSSTPLYSNPWVWGGAAAVVVAATTVLVLVLASGEDPQTGNLGHVDNWPP